MKKILIVGSSIKWSLSMSYYRAFKKLGLEVSIFDDEKTFQSFLNIDNRYIYRFCWRWFSLLIQKKFMKEIKREKPDTILVIKGQLIQPYSLKKIKNEFPNIVLCNLNPDNPFNTWHYGNSNHLIIKSIPLYDIYFIWGKFLIQKLKKAYAQQVEYLPFGYDPELHYPIEVTNEEKEYYGSDISFIGSWDKEREWWLSYLLDYNLKIWGDHWEKASKKIQQRWTRIRVVEEDYSKVCNASKINLNFIRKQNGSAHNMRTFEIPACKGFMISNRTDEQMGIFEEKKEADYFNNLNELKNKIDYYLIREKQITEIKDASYKRLKQDKNSYEDRAKVIIEILMTRELS